MRKRFGKNDLLFIGALFLCSFIILAGFRLFNREGGTKVTISRDGEILMTCSLSGNRTIPIPDSGGKVTNTLEIRNGKAKMVQADCPDGLCLHQKAISIKNENIVCLPNRVVVTVTGDDGGFDGFAQ